MKPQLRPLTGSRLSWGRYDVANHRTLYGAAPVDASYAECLAALRPKFTMLSGPKINELFDESDPNNDEPLLSAVSLEWEERDHLRPGACPAGWRLERLLYRLQLPASGWFVDIETAESIAAVSKALGHKLARWGLTSLTVANLRGENREVTTCIAEWVRSQTLWDGSLPHGIRFRSKHSNNYSCWAVWLRRVDDGEPLTAEPTTADAGTEIRKREHNPPLDRIATLFDLKAF